MAKQTVNTMSGIKDLFEPDAAKRKKAFVPPSIYMQRIAEMQQQHVSQMEERSIRVVRKRDMKKLMVKPQ
jgi:hypothetical protein